MKKNSLLQKNKINKINLKTKNLKFKNKFKFQYIKIVFVFIYILIYSFINFKSADHNL